MRGIVYGVINLETNRIEKVGSTIRPLKERTNGYRHESHSKTWFKNHVLVSIREVEHDDPKFFQILLAVTESLEIGRNKCWTQEGGRNIINPIAVCLGMTLLSSEVGQKASQAAVISKHFKRLKNIPEWAKDIDKFFENISPSSRWSENKLNQKRRAQWRDVMTLYYQEGLTSLQVAERLGLTYQKVRFILRSIFRSSRGLTATGKKRIGKMGAPIKSDYEIKTKGYLKKVRPESAIINLPASRSSLKIRGRCFLLDQWLKIPARKS